MTKLKKNTKTSKNIWRHLLKAPYPGKCIEPALKVVWIIAANLSRGGVIAPARGINVRLPVVVPGFVEAFGGWNVVTFGFTVIIAVLIVVLGLAVVITGFAVLITGFGVVITSLAVVIAAFIGTAFIFTVVIGFGTS